MTITRIELKDFTAFSELKLDVSPGINVFVGANGTGKTHIMKVAYAACEISKSGIPFAEKLIRVFLPSNRSLGRLVRRQRISAKSSISVFRGKTRLGASFSSHSKVADSARVIGAAKWAQHDIETAFIPVKEMLSSGPGFRSLYQQREIHFEEIYADVLDRAYRPALRGRVDGDRRRLMTHLQKAIEGKVTVNKEEFFLRNRSGNLEFSLLAEGIRKLGLLWLLIQNGTLLGGSVLFWDEPEANLNPKLFGPLMEILLVLQRIGVQIFIATHDYVILKELDMQREKQDLLAFHSLYRDEEGQICCATADNYAGIEENAIAATFADLYDRELDSL